MPGPLMMCGHMAHAKDQDGKPVCPICFGIPQAELISESVPDLTGRKARCSYCSKTHESVLGLQGKLAFFEVRLYKDQDSFYCGCLGWD